MAFSERHASSNIHPLRAGSNALVDGDAITRQGLRGDGPWPAAIYCGGLTMPPYAGGIYLSQSCRHHR